MSAKTLELEDVQDGTANEAPPGGQAGGQANGQGAGGADDAAGQDLALAGHRGGGRLPLGELGAISEVPVQLAAVLGRASMPVSQLLRLGRGAVVELDRKVGEPIDIYVNNRLVARGEVVIVDDRLGVTMTEIVKTDRN